MNALLARACRNAAGKVRLRPTPAGVLGQVIPQVGGWLGSGQGSFARAEWVVGSAGGCRGCRTMQRWVGAASRRAGPPPPPPAQARQVFERLPGEGVGGPGGDADARFAHFKAALWPRIRESGRSGGHLIYIPSYFDYVR